MKKWNVKAVVCDLRALTKDDVAFYDTVRIEALNLILSPESIQVLEECGASVKAAKIKVCPNDMVFIMKNGKYCITKTDVQKKRITLIVNGSLEIEEGASEAVKSYEEIQVNGRVIYPESVKEALAGRLELNGMEQSYPDGSIYCARNQRIDQVFSLRALKDACYEVAGKVLMLGEKEELARLVQKGVHINARRGALVTESNLEEAVNILTANTAITVLPDGCSYVEGDREGTKELLGKYGEKLYIGGDLEVKEEEFLDKLSFLRVEAEAMVPKELREKFWKVCKHAGKESFYTGRLVSGKAEWTVTKEQLEEVPGLWIRACGRVRIQEDIPAGLLKSKAIFAGCGEILCTPKQKQTVCGISSDCHNILSDEGKGEPLASGDWEIAAAYYSL